MWMKQLEPRGKQVPVRIELLEDDQEDDKFVFSRPMGVEVLAIRILVIFYSSHLIMENYSNKAISCMSKSRKGL